MLPCTSVSVPAKITRYAFGRRLRCVYYVLRQVLFDTRARSLNLSKCLTVHDVSYKNSHTICHVRELPKYEAIFLIITASSYENKDDSMSKLILEKTGIKVVRYISCLHVTILHFCNWRPMQSRKFIVF